MDEREPVTNLALWEPGVRNPRSPFFQGKPKGGLKGGLKGPEESSFGEHKSFISLYSKKFAHFPRACLLVVPSSHATSHFFFSRSTCSTVPS